MTAAPVLDLTTTRGEDPSGHPGVAGARTAEQTALLQKVRDLQQRVHQVEGTTSAPILETVPGLAELLPHGGLRPGASYAVDSTSLAMALLAAPTTAGTWCGVVGAPEFGAEAAAAMGVDLSRVVFVPEPGHRWITVAAAMIDVLGLVLVKPPGQIHQGEVARLNARLRQRGSTLVAMGSWPQSEARLTILDNTWVGLGDGFGHLAARIATVNVDARGGRARTGRLWLPGTDAKIGPVGTDELGTGSELAPDVRAVG